MIDLRFFDSRIIIEESLSQKLEELLKKKDMNGRKWSLLYQGSRDGFLAYDFHSRCDSKPNTLKLLYPFPFYCNCLCNDRSQSSIDFDWYQANTSSENCSQSMHIRFVYHNFGLLLYIEIIKVHKNSISNSCFKYH